MDPKTYQRDQKYIDVKNPQVRRILVGALIGVLVLIAGMTGVLNSLWTQSGMQWDQEMTGSWVRQSQPNTVGIEIYRVHIVDSDARELTEDMTSFPPSSKLSVAFHFRTVKSRNYDARVKILDREENVVASGEKLGIPNEVEHFSGIVVPLKLPKSPGDFRIRLEVCATDSTRIAFWETDIQLANP